jgi:hypothetical protein
MKTAKPRYRKPQRTCGAELKISTGLKRKGFTSCSQVRVGVEHGKIVIELMPEDTS